ncbi:rhodanese-related sulfurtransferase [Chlamydiales bacterium]|nr:rhodanese-related sulfurtransferase [Chlamydiales bacterium]
MSKIWVLAYYHLVDIDDPKQEMKEHKRFCAQHDLMGRIYIAKHGINGQMSGSPEGAKAYMEWMEGRDLFKGVHFKIHHWHEHCFPRMQIKVKPKVVALDQDINFETVGDHISPKEWKEHLESNNRPLLLDVRNDYEWEIGRFKGCEKPPCNTFRDFDEWAGNLQESVDPKKTPVMMYCTGGIRCELFSSMLKLRGFDQVYQLKGGVINYGLEEGSDHWEGKLFVFDDRMAVPLDEKNTDVIGKCHHCGTPNDSYFNCANMDCNKLFLCCTECVQTHKGCCGDSCATLSSDRIRPVNHQQPHKPFRKWYNYLSKK